MGVLSFCRRQSCRDDFVCSPQCRGYARTALGYVRGAGPNGVELSMPRCLRQDEACLGVVSELVGSNVNDHPGQLKPSMRCLAAVADHVMRAGLSLPNQVFGEQQRGITACAAGEMLKSHRKVARITLLDRTTKGSRQRFYLVRLKVCEGLGHLFFQGQLRKEVA